MRADWLACLCAYYLFGFGARMRWLFNGAQEIQKKDNVRLGASLKT